MNNAILIICYDRSKEQHDLTVDALNSALGQDIPVEIFCVDNGSTYPETWVWLDKMANYHPNLLVDRNETNISPVAVANYWFERLFVEFNYPHVLGMPNDVRLPSDLYRNLLERPEKIAAALADGNPDASYLVDKVERLHGDVHMAVVVTKKSAYDALISKDGYFFDEGYFNYCSDVDFKLRLIDAGISTAQTNVRCYHYGGASHRLAPEGQRGITGTDNDYPYFYRKWNMTVASPECNQRMAKINEER
jgi:glycosyltransferase involved in cell wall biosynthesis